MPVRNALILADIPLFGFRVATSLGAVGIRADVWATHRWSLCRLSRYCSKFLTIPRSDVLSPPSAMAERLDAYCRQRGIDVIIPADLEASRCLVALGSKIKTPTFPLATAAAIDELDDKWSFEKLARRCGVRLPMTRLLERTDQIDALDVDYPLVVKPTNNASSQGVFVIQAREDLHRYVRDGGPLAGLPLIIQEYIPGEDMSVFALADHGRIVAWTMQRRSRAMGGMEFLQNDDMLAMAQTLVAATGYHGVIDFDMRWDDRAGHAVVIEANPRFPGSLLHKVWAGVNFVDLGLRLMEGRPLDFTPVTGLTLDIGLAPRTLLQDAVGLRSPGSRLAPGIRRAMAMNWADPLPHLFRIAAGRYRRLHGGGPVLGDAATHTSAVFAPG